MRLARGGRRVDGSILQRPAAMLGLLLFVSGALFIVTAEYLHSVLPEAPFVPILAEIGRVTLATAIVSLGYEIFLSRDLVHWLLDLTELKGEIWRSGLGAVHREPPYRTDVAEWFSGARDSIEILGAAANGITACCRREIQQALERGVRVRVMLLSEESCHAEARSREEGARGGSIALKIRETKAILASILRDLSPEHHAHLELYEYDQIPYCGLVIVDGSRMRYSPYLASRSALETPAFDFSNDRRHSKDTLVGLYHKYFDECRGRAKPIAVFSPWAAGQKPDAADPPHGAGKPDGDSRPRADALLNA